MQSAKEKVSNVASVAKEKIQIAKAKAEEKAEKAAARTKEEKVIAEEKAKMKEAEARAEMHAAKAQHAAEKLEAKQAGGLHYHVPGTGTGHTTYGTGHTKYGTGTGTGATYGTHDQSVLGGGTPAGTMPGTTTTTTTHHHLNPLGGHPPAYNKHL